MYTIKNIKDFQGLLQQYQNGDEEWGHEDGSIGMKMLDKYNFTIDLSGKTVWFENRKKN